MSKKKSKMVKEKKDIWKPCNIHLQEGDIVTSKKGILFKSPISEEFYLMLKGKYIGDNCWVAIKKIPIDVKEKT